jgi:hypothetical protein
MPLRRSVGAGVAGRNASDDVGMYAAHSAERKTLVVACDPVQCRQPCGAADGNVG